MALADTTLSLSSLLLGAWLAGAAGSVHCLAMCGPIATLLGAQATALPGQRHDAWMPWLYQAGRLSGYALLAAVGGAVVGWFSRYSGIVWAAQGVRLMLALCLLMIGVYLLFQWRALEFITQLGSGPWRYIQPWIRRLLPPRRRRHAFMLGLLWGWLPCGMVYAMLGLAWSTADPLLAAATMLAFGLGTTPMMLGAASGSAWLRARLGRLRVRQLAGVLLISAGLFSLYQLWPGAAADPHAHRHISPQ